VKQLQEFLPICGYCKKIRDDKRYWQRVEEYFGAQQGAKFSHGVCPDCYEREMAPQLRKLGLDTAYPGESPGEKT
jgi:hypothetical protein